MTPDEIVAELSELFANVPRPGIPPGYVPTGSLGNPGWDEFTYHSAVVFAEQVPDHVRRAFESPDVYVPELLWHLSDSERLGVFSNRQIAALLRVLDLLASEFPGSIVDGKVAARLRNVRLTLERLLARPE
jgi:hypothetical protein